MTLTVKVAGYEAPLEHVLFLNLLQYDTRRAWKLSGKSDPLAAKSFEQMIQKFAAGRKGEHEKYEHAVVLLGNLDVECETAGMRPKHEEQLLIITPDKTAQEGETDKNYALLIKRANDFLPAYGLRIRGSREHPPRASRYATGVGEEINTEITIFDEINEWTSKAYVGISAKHDEHTIVSIPRRESYVDGNWLFWATLGSALDLQLQEEGKRYSSKRAQRHGAKLEIDLAAYDHGIRAEFGAHEIGWEVLEAVRKEHPRITGAASGNIVEMTIPRDEIRGSIYCVNRLVERFTAQPQVKAPRRISENPSQQKLF